MSNGIEIFDTNTKNIHWSVENVAALRAKVGSMLRDAENQTDTLLIQKENLSAAMGFAARNPANGITSGKASRRLKDTQFTRRFSRGQLCKYSSQTDRFD